MTEEQEMILNIEEMDTLVQNLHSHSLEAKVSGYYAAAFDMMLAAAKIESMAKGLKAQFNSVSQQ